MLSCGNEGQMHKEGRIAVITSKTEPLARLRQDEAHGLMGIT